MGRIALAVGAAALSALLGGCGDPVIVLGDWPGVVRLTAGVPDRFGETTDQVALRTQLGPTTDVIEGPQGVVYVIAGRRILEVQSNGSLEQIRDDRSCAGSNCLVSPVAAVLSNGTFVVADPGANRIWRVDPRNRSITAIAGTGQLGTSPDGATAATAAISQPGGVAVGPDGRIYFSESPRHVIRRIETNGTLSTFAGTGTPGFDGNTNARQAQLNSPGALLIDGNTLYVADIDNHRVRAMDLNGGNLRTIAGTGAASFSGDGGPATQATLNHPAALAVGDNGQTLFIADAFNNRVRSVNLSTGVITTLVGTGLTAFNGDGQLAAETNLNAPSGLAVADGFLFIADTGHKLVWRTALVAR